MPKRKIRSIHIKYFRGVPTSLSVEIAEKVLRQNLKNDNDQMAMIDRMLDEIIDKRNI